MTNTHDVLTIWTSIFFAEMPPHTIGLFRLLVGIAIVYNGITLLPIASDLFGPNGRVSHQQFLKLTEGRYYLNFLRYLPPATPFLILGIYIFCGSSLIVGLFPSFFSFLAYMCMITLIKRNPWWPSGGDYLLVLFTLLLSFADSGKAFSAMLYWNAGQWHQPEHRQAVWPLRLIQIQVCIVYWRAVFWKLRGQEWRNGIAIFYPLQLEDVIRYRCPKVLLKGYILRPVTWGLMAFQSAWPIMIWWSNTRVVLIAAAMLMHLSFEVFLNLHHFGIIMMVGLTAFIPASLFS